MTAHQKPNDSELTQSRQRLLVKLERDLGPDVMAALRNPRTTDILLNPDGTLWHGLLGEPVRKIGTMTPARAEGALRTIAAALDTTITSNHPMVEGELPIDGSRVAGQIPPIVSAPAFAIRKKAIAVHTLDDYVEQGIMTPDQRAVIDRAVRNHRNILIIGGTGSGKTTLANAIIRAMVDLDAHERFLIIEDTAELQCVGENVVQYVATVDVNMTQLLRIAMRMWPSRIIVGEVRGPEALNLLLAWNSGHEGGIGTLHANNTRSGLTKLAMYVSQHPESPRSIEPLIGEAVHVVIHIARTQDGRRIRDILEVDGYANGQYQTKTL
jgi:type IV secretion system protein VirB11